VSSPVNRKLLPVIVAGGVLLVASLVAVVIYVASLISAMFLS
jgi:hypothetical protein